MSPALVGFQERNQVLLEMPNRLKQKPLGYGDVSHIRRSNGKNINRRFNECLQILVIFLLLMYLSFRYMIIKLRKKWFPHTIPRTFFRHPDIPTSQINFLDRHKTVLTSTANPPHCNLFHVVLRFATRCSFEKKNGISQYVVELRSYIHKLKSCTINFFRMHPCLYVCRHLSSRYPDRNG